MTRILATDSNNDIYLGKNGRLVINSGLQAVLQACEHVVKAQRGEMVLNLSSGIPTFETVWNGSPNLGQFEAAIRTAILSVTGVIRVTELSVSASTDAVVYSATIETVYGNGVVNG